MALTDMQIRQAKSAKGAVHFPTCVIERHLAHAGRSAVRSAYNLHADIITDG